MDTPSTIPPRGHSDGDNLHDVARDLVAYLGAPIVAGLTGCRDLALPELWAQDDGPDPGKGFAERLILARQVWMMLEASEDADIARAWLIGANPMLDDDTPLSAIRELKSREVIAAVTNFIEGS